MPEWMIKGRELADYLQACKEADLSNFKRDKRLTKVFEHCSKEIGQAYYDELPNLHNKINIFSNDKFGCPIIYKYGIDFYSPSTLQYIYVLHKLTQLVGSLTNIRICEIGGGYGGQACTIFDIYKPVCYHIIDLPEVCELQRRYLNGLPVECFTEPPGQEYDLVISNYALSEIPENTQYVNEVLRKSKHGYITCNTEFVNLDWPHTRLPDIKGEAEFNYILVW